MSNSFDAIVLGAGAMGSAAAFQLAKRGQRVLLLEQFEIDHQKGSSYGHSRIIRYAYEHPAYTRLMRSAYPAWSAIEAEADETLYTNTGGLDFGRPNHSSLRSILHTLEAEAVPHEIWTPAEAEKHYPQFRFDHDMLIIYQPDAGILSASKCVRAHIRLAEQYGAVVRANTPITEITPQSASVTVKTASDTYTAARIVIAAGSWAKSVLSNLGIDVPLTPLRCHELYFNTDAPADYEPSRFPTFIAHMLDIYEHSPYGIASNEGSGLKVGLHGGQPVSDPSEINYTPDESASKTVLTFAERHLPGVQSLRSARICLYTMTPDGHFLIDKHPEYPHIVFGAGYSGHGFKFSALMGSILADLALSGKTEHDISLFGLSRFQQIAS